MLPQGNSQTENEEKNEKNEMPSVTSADTPMRNPAIAAIDRLLFYSPITTGIKMEATKDIKVRQGQFHLLLANFTAFFEIHFFNRL